MAECDEEKARLVETPKMKDSRWVISFHDSFLYQSGLTKFAKRGHFDFTF